MQETQVQSLGWEDPLEEEMQSAPVFLPGESHGQRSLAPVASHLPPENPCQSDLFQMVERRYHMDYNQNHVASASNELFFKDVVPEIQKKVKREPALRDPLRKAFSNSDEMLAYYKDKYKFNTQIEQF